MLALHIKASKPLPYRGRKAAGKSFTNRANSTSKKQQTKTAPLLHKMYNKSPYNLQTKNSNSLFVRITSPDGWIEVITINNPSCCTSNSTTRLAFLFCIAFCLFNPFMGRNKTWRAEVGGCCFHCPSKSGLTSPPLVGGWHVCLLSVVCGSEGTRRFVPWQLAAQASFLPSCQCQCLLQQSWLEIPFLSLSLSLPPSPVLKK